MNPTPYIACVGSRETPADILLWMTNTAAELVRNGFGIISGNSTGADQAWARGGNSVDPTKVTLCLPWAGFERQAIHPDNVVQLADWDYDRCQRVVHAFHPRTEALSPGAMKLHARNVMIVEPAIAVVGYLNPTKKGGGGSGMAFKLAGMRNLPALNVADERTRGLALARLEMRREWVERRRAA